MGGEKLDGAPSSSLPRKRLKLLAPQDEPPPAVASPEISSSILPMPGAAAAAAAAACGAPGEGQQLVPSPRVDMLGLLPEPLALRILALVPPRTVAAACALTCTAWAALCSQEHLWKEMCMPWGLTDADVVSVLGGWRGLFVRVFGANLVQSPCFEGVERISSLCPVGVPLVHQEEVDALPPRLQDPRPFQASATLHLDCFPSTLDAEPQYRTLSHWVEDRGAAVAAPLGVLPSWPTCDYFRAVVAGPEAGMSGEGPLDREHHVARLTHIPASFCGGGGRRETAGLKLSHAPLVILRGAPWGSAMPRRDPMASKDCDDPAHPSSQCSSTAIGTPEAQPLLLPPGDEVRLPKSPSSPYSKGPLPGDPALRVHGGPKPPGKVTQCIQLHAFPRVFLDRRPPLQISAWCCAAPLSPPSQRSRDGTPAQGWKDQELIDEHATCAGETGELRLEAKFLCESGERSTWDSGCFKFSDESWQEARAVISDYPKELHSIILQVSGKGVVFTKVRMHFLHAT